MENPKSYSISLSNAPELTSYSVKDNHLTSDTFLFGAYDDGKYSDTKSSLEINANKKEYKNGKWKGTLTWSWSFFNEDKKGFVTVNEATTSDTETQLILTVSILCCWEGWFRQLVES